MFFRDENKKWHVPFGDAFGDPNEQEQGKCAHEDFSEVRREVPQKSEPTPTPMPREDIPCQFPIECPPRSVPDSFTERRLVQTSGEALFDGTPKSSKGMRRRSARFGGYLVMSASLLLAFLLMIGALCSFPREPIADEQMHEEPDGEAADKVVFVDRFTDGAGALSTPELYHRCISSVVSISVHDGKNHGVGSGFVLREDGYIATAYHVVAEMPKIEVIMADESRYEASLVGGDALTDLALLKIEATGLAPVTFGSSSEILAGERVVAIGTPASLDYAGSVSSGEVSYTLRTVKIYGEDRTLEKKMKLIQTNAPVNPGNSGCPLFDGYGRVVGMITMKLGSSFSGMGFAIPSDGAIGILEAMRTGQALNDEVLAAVSVRAASLGIVGEACSLDGAYGVRVTGYQAPMDQPILWMDDVILTIDEHAVTRMADIDQVLSAYEPRDTVKVTVLRHGQRLLFEVVLQSNESVVKK